ncbi:putative GTP-binding protein [Escherichia coli]|nr:putative GTP-binding protein [Escherichia coli]
MVITDLPGVGESRDREAEYEALYRDILPELDLVLWLIKADDRALSVDEYFWRHILHRGHQRVLFVVMQADKTEPCHEWDMAGIQPSPAQAQNIREKTERYSVCSGPYIGLLPYRPAPAGNWIRWSVRS